MNEIQAGPVQRSRVLKSLLIFSFFRDCESIGRSGARYSK